MKTYSRRSSTGPKTKGFNSDASIGSMAVISGIIFDIKRYAINDGPGIRTTVFLKGCPLSCIWCHNPESVSFKPQKMYNVSKCIGCGKCVSACPNLACRLTKEGIVTDPTLCRECGGCADVCPTKAAEMSGRSATVDSIMKIIGEEVIFYDQSGGGVTFSGGEPLAQPEFLTALLTACGEGEIHRTVDTSGFASTEILLNVAEETDFFLYDLKVMDPEKHKRLTGVDNKKILDNLRILAEAGADIAIRIPLIRGINDDAGNIDETARFVSNLAGSKKEVHLIPFHNIAEGKYAKLGVPYNPEEMKEPTEAEQNAAVKHFERYGVSAQIGG
jgi:pyruvate formate lyase activating enzyme